MQNWTESLWRREAEWFNLNCRKWTVLIWAFVVVFYRAFSITTKTEKFKYQIHFCELTSKKSNMWHYIFTLELYYKDTRLAQILWNHLHTLRRSRFSLVLIRNYIYPDFAPRCTNNISSSANEPYFHFHAVLKQLTMGVQQTWLHTKAKTN